MPPIVGFPSEMDTWPCIKCEVFMIDLGVFAPLLLLLCTIVPLMPMSCGGGDWLWLRL